MFLLSCIKLYWRPGFSDRSYSIDIRAASLSGASSRKAKLTRSICSYFGKVKSKSLAIKVESIPPEKSTAIFAKESFEVVSNNSRMLLVISLTLSIRSVLTLQRIAYIGSEIFCNPNLRKSI